MCVGSSSSARAGSSARQQLGRAAQRRVQTLSTKSVFQPGLYQVKNVKREEGRLRGGNVVQQTLGNKYAGDTRRVQINTRKEYNALRNTEVAIRSRGFVQGADGGITRQRRWADTGRKATLERGDIVRIGGQDFVNEVRPDKQSRVAMADESQARIKTRQARSGMREEANARSRSTRKKGRGLRIGGSGVSVPGSTGVQ